LSRRPGSRATLSRRWPVGARGIGKGLSFAQGTPGFDRLNQVLAFLNTSFFAAFGPL
jgi:glutathione S-transferase